MSVMTDGNYLTSTDALKQIVAELKELQTQHDASRSLAKDIVTAFSPSSSLPWPYIILSVTVSIALFCSAAPFGSAHFGASFILCILVVNGLLSVWEQRKKTNEVTARIQWCIGCLRDVYEETNLMDCLQLDRFHNLLNNCDTAAISSSPSHSISQVYRAHIGGNHKKLTAIPTGLLATGDYVSLWPGQKIPARLQCAEDECCVFEIGEVYDVTRFAGCTTNEEENPKSRKFKVLESPILYEIKLFLSSIKKKEMPSAVFERQRNFLLMWFLKFIIPGLLVIAYVTSTIRYFFLPHPILPGSDFTSIKLTDGNLNISVTNSHSYNPIWYKLFIQIPVMVSIPLLPILLPSTLMILVAVGEAKTMAVCQIEQFKHNSLLATPTMSSQAFFFKNETSQKTKWRELLPQLLWGKDRTSIHMNAGLFIPLGSLTVLCCVDKEGILSWFNPIVEKVFFFKNNPCENAAQRNIGDDSLHKDVLDGAMPPVLEENEDQTNASLLDQNQEMSPSSEDQKVVPETLVLSQDSHNPSHVRFDDLGWKDHLRSLKPIGLNIIINLCSCSPTNQNTFEWTDFKASFGSEIGEKLNQVRLLHAEDHFKSTFSHEHELFAVAFNTTCLPPGVRMARKGLCCFAEIIGFVQDLKLAYSDKRTFTAYKKPYCPSLNRLSLMDENISFPIEKVGSFTKRNKWKQYLPYLQGTVVQDLFGDKQVLVYGTGDLITELCREVWDGEDVLSMSVQDRRKAVDFYQRSSVAGQCVAFAYIPFTPKNLNTQKSFKNDFGKLVNLSKVTDRKDFEAAILETESLNSMIFLGMTTLQHQARFSVCQMVDMLDQACIRFVYFSADNEVRSRVFAEKMGLETGWNCHISLASSSNDYGVQESKTSQLQNRSESSKSRSSSEGGAAKPKPATDEDEDLTSPSSHLLERMSPRTQSESSTTDSIFNVSNRAKLPRGIKNIVPHIENVDNVPLLVPLFTDVTPETACDMIQIMQDYGETVCCIGSSDCIRNMSLFHHSNVSLAIEPVIYPKQCHTSSLASSRSNSSIESSPVFAKNPAPMLECVAMKTARKLHCFSCPLLLSGDSSLSIVSNMITQARHFLFLLRIFFIFLIKCEITLSLLQLLSCILLLPAPFMPMDIFWLSFIVCPFLSLSLLGSPPDHDLMTWANQKTSPKECPVTCFMLRQSTKRYLVKFLPSVLLLLACYAMSLHSTCLSVKGFLQPKELQFAANASLNLTIPFTSNNSSTLEVLCYPHFLIAVASKTSSESSVIFHLSLWDASNLLHQKKRAIQLTVMFFTVSYLCTISIGYVNRWKKLTNSPPYLNKLWCITVPTLILCQAVGAIILFNVVQTEWILMFNYDHANLHNFISSWDILNFGRYQTAVWTILAIWPLPCIACNEFWKWREIKMWNRCQKRARLDFGTKLGMNSPF